MCSCQRTAEENLSSLGKPVLYPTLNPTVLRSVIGTPVIRSLQLPSFAPFERKRQRKLHASGDHSAVVPPVPIPNTEVKRCSPNDSASLGGAKVGRRQSYRPAPHKGAGRLFFGGYPSAPAKAPVAPKNPARPVQKDVSLCFFIFLFLRRAIESGKGDRSKARGRSWSRGA